MILNNIGACYCELKRCQEALRYLTDSLALNDTAEARWNAGRSYEWLGDYTAAKQYILSAIELSDNEDFRSHMWVFDPWRNRDD